MLSTAEGDLTVLDGHTPLIGSVVPCEVRVELPDGSALLVAVHGGFVQVDTSHGAAEGLAEGDGPLPGLSTRVTVLAGVAELAGEIDVSRAELARELATQRVSEHASGRGPAAESGEAASEANLGPGRGAGLTGPRRAAPLGVVQEGLAPGRRTSPGRPFAGAAVRRLAGSDELAQTNWMALYSASLAKA